MAAGYRSGGVDFDQMFEPGALANWGFRRAGGGPTQYAPRNGIPPRPNTGYRNPNGTDVSNDWLPLGSAPPMPGFNGRSYSASALAPTNQTGNTSATVTLTLNTNGTWIATRSIAGGGGGTNGTFTIESGTWLPSGASVSDFSVLFTYSGDTSQTTVNNGASSSVGFGTNRAFSLNATVLANSIQNNSGVITLYVHLTRNGAGTTIAQVTLGASAVGWQ